MESTVKLGFEPIQKPKQTVKMNVESKNQEVNPGMRVSGKRTVESQKLESQKKSNQEWPIMTATNKNNQVKTKEYQKP